ncbi:MAG: creatininase family protein [Sphaerochaetaceae bacterium]|nr:creatininase family protein [Sphaerochaetaceae bacterium]
MRTRILSKMLNDEVQEYLKDNDVIIVPVGTVEMHGGFPLDVETVVSEAFALKLAEKCNALVLTNLPYFYAGATASGRGTVQVSVRQGIDYLGAIARSLLRQGFKRQIYISLHGPAQLTISPMVRDFYDETGVPILYIDMMKQVFGQTKDLFSLPEPTTGKYDDYSMMRAFDSIFISGYKVMGRLEDLPITTKYFHTNKQTCEEFKELFGLAYQSGSIGYCLADNADHASTTPIPNAETRQWLADKGEEIMNTIVENINISSIVDKMKNLENYCLNNEDKFPWMPSAYKKHPYNA